MSTARDICTNALRLDGIIAANEAGEAADLDLCLKLLNNMFSSWSLNRNNILSTVIEQFPLVLNQASYTIGPGGDFNTTLPLMMENSSFVRYQSVDFSLTPIDEETYSLIPYKPTGGIPEVYWFNRDVTQATVTFYPVPQSQQVLFLHSVKPFTSFANLDTNYNFGPGYEDTLTFSLAERIAAPFERDIPKAVMMEAMRLRKALKRSNVVVPVQDISRVPAPTGSDWNTWRSYP